MPRLEFKHYCNLTAFRAVPASLYRDLLGKYADACRARGLDPATLGDDDRSREALLAFFTEPGPDLPGELLRAMQETGHVQIGSGGAHRVAVPADPEADKGAPRGDLFVTYDVPTSSLKPAGQANWQMIPGPDSAWARLAAKKGQPLPEMPKFQNLKVEMEKQ